MAEAVPHAPPDPMQRCGKHTRSGRDCHNWAIRGGTVCRMHGGAAPQVKAKAEDRLRAMVTPALDRLEKLIEDESPSVALSAVKDVLDRAGYGAKQRLEVYHQVRQEAERLAYELGMPLEDFLRQTGVSLPIPQN